MDNGIVQIILAVMTLLTTIITVVFGPYMKAKYSEIKRAEIEGFIDKAVKTAEQILKLYDPDGTKRKAFVLEQVNKKGFKITEDELNIIIESAVKDLNIIQDSLL